MSFTQFGMENMTYKVTLSVAALKCLRAVLGYAAPKTNKSSQTVQFIFLLLFLHASKRKCLRGQTVAFAF